MSSRNGGKARSRGKTGTAASAAPAVRAKGALAERAVADLQAGKTVVVRMQSVRSAVRGVPTGEVSYHVLTPSKENGETRVTYRVLGAPEQASGIRNHVPLGSVEYALRPEGANQSYNKLSYVTALDRPIPTRAPRSATGAANGLLRTYTEATDRQVQAREAIVRAQDSLDHARRTLASTERQLAKLERPSSARDYIRHHGEEDYQRGLRYMRETVVPADRKSLSDAQHAVEQARSEYAHARAQVDPAAKAFLASLSGTPARNRTTSTGTRTTAQKTPRARKAGTAASTRAKKSA